MFVLTKDHKIMFRLLFFYIPSNIVSDRAVVSTEIVDGQSGRSKWFKVNGQQDLPTVYILKYVKSKVNGHFGNRFKLDGPKG